jgi:predicted ribosome quality control (RQC) complex YloA/Tae2 family protein
VRGSLQTISRSDTQERCFVPDAKKVMTSFDLQAIAKELESTIRSARVDNIYQFSQMAFLLTLHPQANLVMEAGRRVHLTHYRVERPDTPSLFCSILRRHLRGGTVQSVGVEDFERVLFLEVSSDEGTRKLVVEVFGGGNVLLLDEKGAIVQALTYRRMRDRNIIRGETYRLPPPRGTSPEQASLLMLSSLTGQKGDVARAIGRVLSIGSPYVEEVVLRAGLEKAMPASSLSDEQVKSILEAVSSLIRDLGQPHPRIVSNDIGCWLDIVPFPLLQYETKRNIEFVTCNEAADAYFTELASKTQVIGETAETEANIEEQRRILRQQEERITQLEEEASSNQRAGNLLYVHFSEVQGLLEVVRQRKSGSDRVPEGISLDNDKRRAKIKIEDQEIDLDLRLSVHENAAGYYELAKGARQKMEGLTKAIQEAERRLKSRQEKTITSRIRLPSLVRRRAWYESFHWARTKTGTLIVGGRDATTNEILIKKHMDTKDLVFHTDAPGAPFVLTKPNDSLVSEDEISQAAQMAASYSSAWKARLASADVYWIRPEQVTKEAPSGEYLTRGAFMIRGQKNYLRNVQLRISIGLLEEEGGLQVVGGPQESVHAQTELAVEIIPGRLSSGALAKEVRRKLASKMSDLRPSALALPLEEFQQFIPPGGGDIISS